MQQQNRQNSGKFMVANSKIKHKFEIMLEVIRGLKLDFVSLLFYCMTKYPLHVISSQNTR